MSDSFHFTFGGFRSEVLWEEDPHIPALQGEGNTLTVFDRNTYRLFGRQVPKALVLKPGERSKSWQGIRWIIDTALARGLARDSLFVGVGGGVICDLAAFGASLYMRGCRLVLVPTSLLAMVDAAIGGKTGINRGHHKNMVGTFYPAEQIRIPVGALKSLPRREFQAGLAEGIKAAMLGDRELFRLLAEQRAGIMARDPSLLREFLRRAIAVKGRIVEEDFRESGRRAILNLGHTFAHALESVGRLRTWNHGEAVAWGLAKAMELGLRLGVTDPDYAREVRKLLSGYHFRLEAGRSLAVPALLRAMRLDKKRGGGKLRLVIQRGICDTSLQQVDERVIEEVLRQ